MQKVLHPGYFPYFQFNENICYNPYPNSWNNFTLEQAMAAYWKVKSWNFSIFGLIGLDGGGSGSTQVIVNADKMSDLVCPTASYGYTPGGSGNVLSVYGFINMFGISMTVECFDQFQFIYISDGSYGGYGNGVQITIGDDTIFTYGFWNLPAVSANIQITATSFF